MSIDNIFTPLMYVVIFLSGTILFAPQMTLLHSLLLCGIAYGGLVTYPTNNWSVDYYQILKQALIAFIGGIVTYGVVFIIVFFSMF